MQNDFVAAAIFVRLFWLLNSDSIPKPKLWFPQWKNLWKPPETAPDLITIGGLQKEVGRLSGERQIASQEYHKLKSKYDDDLVLVEYKTLLNILPQKPVTIHPPDLIPAPEFLLNPIRRY